MEMEKNQKHLDLKWTKCKYFSKINQGNIQQNKNPQPNINQINNIGLNQNNNRNVIHINLSSKNNMINCNNNEDNVD